MKRKSIRFRRNRNRIKKEFELQLTSMMDMLIIIVVFLLKSYAANSVIFNASSKIVLPSSLSQENPMDSPSLVVEPTGIVFDNEKVVEFVQNAPYQVDTKNLTDGNRRILPLYDALVKARERAELIMSKAKWVEKPIAGGSTTEPKQVPPKFQGILVIQADKTVKYELMKKVMYTAGAAQYKTFKLVTIKKDG